MATSDLPGGVVNLLTGSAAEIGPWLAAHLDVNAIDLAGVGCRAGHRAGGRRGRKPQARPAHRPAEDWNAEPTLDRLARWIETKTVWHPIGV